MCIDVCIDMRIPEITGIPMSEIHSGYDRLISTIIPKHLEEL